MLESIAALVRTGRIVEFALAIVAVEAVVLIVRKDRLGGASALFKALAHLASGAFLMIALWCALTDQSWSWVAGALLGALMAHACDLGLALRDGRR
ncbi:MAG: hypothetical protein ACOYLQ_07790 [Hyphomicrobiaceae bacterium]